VSLFGKMIPFKPDIAIPGEVREFLEVVMVEARGKSDDDCADEEMLGELYQDLEVVMFFEILTHLPGEYLETFVNMNDQSVAREELDDFLMRNVPNAEDVFEMVLYKFRHYYSGD
jgi:hypothetical protein